MNERLFIGADHTITLTGARADGAYLNAATVSWELFGWSGTSLASGTCSYVASSSGNYAGVLESTATAGLARGRRYYLIVTLVQGGYNDRRRIDLTAADRGGGD